MRAIRVFGYILFYGFGAWLYVLGLIFYYALWGMWGLIGSFIVFPAAEIFPIIVWIITKEFPLMLFLIAVGSWSGAILIGISSRND
jgi:hypothetical protein